VSPSTKGIVLKILSTLVFAAMVTLIKLASDEVPPGEVLFARAFFGIIPVLIWLAWRRELPAALATRQPWGHVQRAVVGTISMFCWFASIAYLPLPDATAINYSGPLFGVVFAALLLKEKVRVYRWTAVAVGFVGVLIVLSEQMSGFGAADPGRATGAVLSLTSAVFAALAMVTVRNLTMTETTGSIVFYFSSSAAAMALFTIPFGWVVPSPYAATVLVLAGLCGGVGQVLMTSAYRHAEASVIAPFDYANMLWIVTIAYLVFGDVPTALVLVGSAIVIASGVFVMWRERRLGRKAAGTRSVPPK
jgi:drug/metabolite transporter (DMT)-like permease